jgi:hypothetical protein
MHMVAHPVRKTSPVAKLCMPRQDDPGTMVILGPGPCFSS